MQNINRRDFLKLSAWLASTVAVVSVTGCSHLAAVGLPQNPVPLQFNHGVASGDATTDAVILWTKITVPAGFTAPVQLFVEVSQQADFSRAQQAMLTVTADTDYCCKVDFTGLEAGQQYFYRFRDAASRSVTGRTRTIPVGPLDKARFAVVSCSNYPAGYFHVYDALAKLELDAVIHLGDYIYEYPHDGYATEHAAALGRTFAPDNRGEIITLADYRRRYALYRQDAALQAVHQQQLFLVVWDDHEICNDAWPGGAENHTPDEGDFSSRKLAALQAYYEWMPIRPRVQQGEPLYRALQYGELARLILLDTRLQGRAEPLDFAKAKDAAAQRQLLSMVQQADRQLLGQAQQDWLATQFNEAAGRQCWAILAQQVLMSRMVFPLEILQGLAQPAPQLIKQLEQWLALEQRANSGALLTAAEQQRLQQPRLPYNLDAWDGYPAAREQVYQAALPLTKPLLVLAGDTHNAWTSTLRAADGREVGIELATASVSSPGIESYLKLTAAQAQTLAPLLSALIPELEQCDVQQRGYLLLELTAQQMQAQWWFVSDILQRQYQQTLGMQRTLQV